MSEEKARAIVKERAGGVCEAAIANVCFGHHDSTHHRRKQRYRDTQWAASNLIATCGSGTTGCHGYIEANPKWAMSQGLWLTEAEDPREVSVYMRWGQIYAKSWWALDDEGMLEHDGGEFEPVMLSPAVRDFFSPPTSFTRSSR